MTAPKKSDKVYVGITLRALYALVLVAGAGVPLLFSPWQHNAFDLAKAMAARLLAGLALLLLVYGAGRGGLRGRWWRSPAGPALILAGVLLAATAFSVDPALSLWGSYERQFGTLTWLAPLVLFLAGLAVLHNAQRRQRLLRVLVWGSAPVVLYGAVQALGADPFTWDSDGTAAVLGTMGRSNFLGAYLVLIIPLTVSTLLAAGRRWPLAALLAGQVAVLGLARARAAWLGLLAAGIAYGLLWLVANGRWRLAGRVVLAGLGVGIVLLTALVLAGVPGTVLEGGSPAARLAIWRATVPLLAARPLLGYGPDTMGLAFQEVFPPELVYYQGRHLLVDRAHNLWLDLGMSAGVLGVVAFAAVLFAVARRLWRGLLVAEERQRQLALIGVAAAAAGHLVDLQFSFETVGTAVVFWLVLAAGAAGVQPVAAPEPEGAGETAGASPLFPWKSLLPALAWLVLLGMLSARPLLADAAYRRGQLSDPGSTAALRHHVEATQQWPLEPLYRLALGQAFWSNGQQEVAASETVSAARLRPGDVRLWAAVGDLYARWGATDPDRHTQALAAYRRAVELSPNTAAYHTALGLVLAESGDLAAGIEAVERAVALDATDAVAYSHLARLYGTAGWTEQAEWAAAQARLWSAAGQRGF